jgi:hypothetical protein
VTILTKNDFEYECPFALDFKKHLDECCPDWYYEDGRIFREMYTIYFSRIDAVTGHTIQYSISAKLIHDKPCYSSISEQCE